MPGRKWTFDYEFFSKRSPVVAYWAGFLMADGGLSKSSVNSWYLALILQPADRSHLERFCVDVGLSIDAIYCQKYIEHTVKGRIVPSGESFGVHLSATNLADDLRPWGIIPRKTYNFVEPQIPNELLRHYLRGWADGDGQIYASGTGARFTVCGNPLAMKWYEEALRRLGYSGGVSYQHRSAVTDILYIGGANQVKEVISILLKPGDFKLDRKWTVHYDMKHDLIDTICKTCGKHFGVRKFRSAHPTQGKFCSKACFDVYQTKPKVDGKTQCARCKEWFLEMSGNKSYCKKCWHEKGIEQRKKAKSLKNY